MISGVRPSSRSPAIEVAVLDDIPGFGIAYNRERQNTTEGETHGVIITFILILS